MSNEILISEICQYIHGLEEKHEANIQIKSEVEIELENLMSNALKEKYIDLKNREKNVYKEKEEIKKKIEANNLLPVGQMIANVVYREYQKDSEDVPILFVNRDKLNNFLDHLGLFDLDEFYDKFNVQNSMKFIENQDSLKFQLKQKEKNFIKLA